MSRKPPPRIVVETHEGFRTIFQTGIFGGGRAGFFEWVIYTDEMVTDDALTTVPPDPAKIHIKRTLQCQIRITPFEAKGFAEWLNSHITDYEKTFGKILTPKDLEKKGKKPPPPHMIT